eukprot:TRINITY_DN24917_c0_g1_i2.p4 TRINITY_DN24917_c0_g1~~TRINITY_DN24917_c0_g1_i2.p4  ORF type:complete len:127 (+),score=18.85 TRINITY_DN24917_c0_g1_i2:278-658(+)
MRSKAAGFYRSLLGRILTGGGPAWPAPPEQPTAADVASDPGLPAGWQRLRSGGTCWKGFLAQVDFEADDFLQCLAFCEQTSGCVVAAFNGLCCMAYDDGCDIQHLRVDGERAGYRTYRRAGLEAPG